MLNYTRFKRVFEIVAWTSVSLLRRNHLLFIQWPSTSLPTVRYIFCQVCGIYNFSASIHATSPRNQLLSTTASSTQPVVIHHSCIHATSCYSFQRRIHNSTTLSLAKLKVSFQRRIHNSTTLSLATLSLAKLKVGHNQRNPNLRNMGAQETRPCDVGRNWLCTYT